MLSYILAGAATGLISTLSAFGVANWTASRRGASTTMDQEVFMAKIAEVETRVLQTILPAIETAAKENAAMAEHFKQAEARTTASVNAITGNLGALQRSMVTREEVAQALQSVVSREELELALQSAAQQILRVAQNGNGNGSGRTLSALQEQVAGISQQLGLG